MKVVAIALLSLIGAAAFAAGGYWLGFRHAWQRGLMADAPVRGALAMHYIQALERDQTETLRVSFESDIDSGLLWWAELEGYPLFGAINTLSGQDVTPGLETYVRRIATYRKAHSSPFRDPALVNRMLDSAKEHDPAFAENLEASGLETEAHIDRMIEKYAQ